MAKATYLWYKKFNQNISFEDVGGDLINKKIVLLLEYLLN